jgi:hypothetical protein
MNTFVQFNSHFTKVNNPETNHNIREQHFVEEIVTPEVMNKRFKINLESQLQFIRNILQHAIDLAGSYNAQSKEWWMTNEIQTAAAEAQIRAIKDIFTNKNCVRIAYAGLDNACVSTCTKKLQEATQLTIVEVDHGNSCSIDAVLAPHTLYSEMESIFKASERLLDKTKPLPIEEHPLFKYFTMLNKEGVFIITLNSGPNIQDLTNIMLNKHELNLTQANQSNNVKLKIFNNVETFFRCFDIFKKYFEEKTGQVINCDLSFSMPHTPLSVFCEGYVRHYPELATLTLEERESFVRLLSVFNIGNDIVDCNITLKLSLQEKGPSIAQKRSFKPILDLNEIEKTNVAHGSNEISLGQLDLGKQIQNLKGSELSMIHIKDADGEVQYETAKRLLSRKKINMVDLGGGRGETNAVPQAIRESQVDIHLLNVEPHGPFAEPYIKAHQNIGVQGVQVLQKTAQDLSANDILHHFNGEKVDLLFASHFLYCLLGDMHKATLDSSISISQHPLWKYFEMMDKEGVFILTMQSGSGARLFREALLGNHGLGVPTSETDDETKYLLKSLGNLATALRHLEVFAERYKQATGKTIHIKMRHSVANVPLGGFNVSQDKETGGYQIHNPNGEDTDPKWLAPKMLDFYGNWAEQQTLATKTGNLSTEELKKRETARKAQETFLHILRVFAPAEVNMQHPNITLEMTLS